MVRNQQSTIANNSVCLYVQYVISSSARQVDFASSLGKRLLAEGKTAPHEAVAHCNTSSILPFVLLRLQNLSKQIDGHARI
jgi:hypothetical protein